MAVTTETIVGEHTIGGVDVFVQKTTWRGKLGASYDVLYASNSAEIRDVENDDAFDHYPSTEEMHVLISAHRDDWVCPGCTTRVDAGDVRDHVQHCILVNGAGQAI